VSLSEKKGAARFEVHAKPRARKSRILGWREGRLEVSLAAAPVDGAANAELIAVLAKALGVPKSAVALVHGQGGRTKLIEVHGLSDADVRARFSV
jgi:uncharacterized protein